MGADPITARRERKDAQRNLERVLRAAHELFSVLRELDDEGVQLIWVEEPPTGPEWDGVRDRLTRAAAT